MRLITEPYLVQQNRWPAAGRHILAQYDDSKIIETLLNNYNYRAISK